MPLPDSAPVPEWVELGAKPNRGLDLTGLRLPVQAIGNSLLDGITTITPSVRYVSFFSWIALSYLNARRPDNWRSFQSFAEPVETAIAIGNILRNRQVTGVVGALGAARAVDAAADPAPLTALVEQAAANIYFNPCLQLKFLMAPKIEVPGLSTERGVPLAEFISGAVGNTRLGARFSSGEVISDATLSDLKEFGEATYIAGISEQESDLLINGLLPVTPKSDEEFRRIGTYGCVLGIADVVGGIPAEDDFFEEAQQVNRTLPQALQGVLNGWFRYLIRDSVAVGHEYLLQELTQTLLMVSKSRTGVPSSEVISVLLQDVQTQNDALVAVGLLHSGENAHEITFNQLYSRIDESTAGDRIVDQGLSRWSGPISELALITAIRSSPAKALALLPVIWCMAAIRASSWQNPLSNPFDGRGGLGWNSIGVHEVITPTVKKFADENWRLNRVMAELALRTIEQHLRVSWSRMAVDVGHDVALLTTEGDRWQPRLGEKHVADYRAGRSASRIYQVISWLQQLNLIDKAGLTSRGKTAYQRVLSTLPSGAI